jgi:hypothetical protein
MWFEGGLICEYADKPSQIVNFPIKIAITFHLDYSEDWPCFKCHGSRQSSANFLPACSARSREIQLVNRHILIIIIILVVPLLFILLLLPKELGS